MPDLQASRRLVKSPPELWAEVSDAGALARHLGQLGEIRITRLEPETTVAWEGERASGTIELAPAGWGTAVTFTAQPVETAERAEPARAVEPAAVAVPEPQPDPEPVLQAEPEPEPAPARRSWFAGLLRRRASPDSAPAPAPEPAPTPVEAAAPEPVAAPAPAPADPVLDALTGALDSLGRAHHRPFSRG
jgi:hypothetical protein